MERVSKWLFRLGVSCSIMATVGSFIIAMVAIHGV